MPKVPLNLRTKVHIEVMVKQFTFCFITKVKTKGARIVCPDRITIY